MDAMGGCAPMVQCELRRRILPEVTSAIDAVGRNLSIYKEILPIMNIQINNKWYEVTSIKYKGEDNAIYKTNPFNIQDVMLDAADHSYNYYLEASANGATPTANGATPTANGATPTANDATLTEQDTQLCADNERIAALEQQLTQLTNTLGVEYTCTGEIRSRRLDELEKDAAYLKEMLVKNDTIMLGQSTRIGELEELLRSVVQVLDIEKTEAKTDQDGAISCSYSSNTIGELYDRIISLEQKAARSTTQEPIREQVDWEQRRYEIAKTLFTNYAFSSNKPVKKAIEKADQLIKQLKSKNNEQ
jgi:hypothetical protein